MIGVFWLRGYTGGMMGLAIAALGFSSAIALIGIIVNPTPWSLSAVLFVFFCYVFVACSLTCYFDNSEENNSYD
jgi:hypothetical protein